MKVSTIVHEFGQNGQHRILLIDDQGEASPGPWKPYDAVAQHQGYYATTEYYEGDLPVGIFKCSAVAHKTITG